MTLKMTRCVPNMPIFLLFFLVVFVEFYFIVWQAMTLRDSDILKFLDSGSSDWILQECMDSTKGGKEKGSLRDCFLGEGEECTRESPCTPCDAQNMNEYQSQILNPLIPGSDSWAHWPDVRRVIQPCRTCESLGTGTQTRACNFVQDVGPYCRYINTGYYNGVKFTNWDVRPCEICCSEEMNIVTNTSANGTLLSFEWAYSNSTR